MAMFKSAMKKVRTYGGSILKFIGLGTVATKVTSADDTMSDWMTMGVIGLIVILLIGRR